ncbi:hypothetical protein JCM8097_009073 [Rhodosporidiobolus ruineniae]
MFARASSVAALFAVLFALFQAEGANALMSQGSINLERRVILFVWQAYSTSAFASTEAFCKKLRSSCVSYVGSIGTYGSHHQLDCVFQLADGTKVQEGSRPWAFCGGIAKNADGTWTNGADVTDYTKEVVKKYFSGTATVKGTPVSKKTCQAIAKSHCELGIVCP